MKHMIFTRGYTLIEAIVMVGVFAILSVMIANSILYLYRTHSQSISQAVSLTTANKGMDQMVQEIRGAAYGEDGSYPIAAFGTSTVTFYADVDQDNKAERVRYFLSGTDIQRGIIHPSGTSSYPVATESVTTLVHDIRNIASSIVLFQYYDASNNATTSPSAILNIRRIVIEMAVNNDPGRQPVDVMLKSSAAPRNIIISQ